jgi:hypothetical protein
MAYNVVKYYRYIKVIVFYARLSSLSKKLRSVFGYFVRLARCSGKQGFFTSFDKSERIIMSKRVN